MAGRSQPRVGGPGAGSGRRADRALVLGGGGPVGIAWEAGVLSALAEAGVDVASADAVIGTSAGSVVGALLGLGREPREIAAAYAEPPDPVPAARRPGMTGETGPAVAYLFARMREAMLGDRPDDVLAAELGARALSGRGVDEETFLEVFEGVRDAARGAPWPPQYACTARDAATGSLVVWDADSGVDLVRAVASSCAVPGVYCPVELQGRRYIDGGVLSPTNAHLASGADCALVLAVTEGFLRAIAHSLDRESPLEREIAVLHRGGTRVCVIELDGEAGAAFGTQLMNVLYQPVGLREGLRQGRAVAERVRSLWSRTDQVAGSRNSLKP